MGATHIALKEDGRFLGVWLDRKLRWRAHLREVRKKLNTQKFALTRLAAKTWGPSLVRARELYTKVVRSILAFRVLVYHQLTLIESKLYSLVVRLETEQNGCL